MRLHKECFDALVQFRIESLTENLAKMSPILKEATISLRKSPSPESLDTLVNLHEFNVLAMEILQYEVGSDGELTVTYLKDASLLLSLVAAVREADIEEHLEAERKLSEYAFAYDHPNYARYNTYHNSYLLHLKQANHRAFLDLKEKGMGGSISGQKFSSIHGDLVTELFNKETKGTAGPFRAGFSSDIDSVNNWVNTIHIHAMLRVNLLKFLHISTSSKHKELTDRGKRLHADHVKKLKEKLHSYGADPFSSGVPKHLTSGKQLHELVIKDFIRAPDVGKKFLRL